MGQLATNLAPGLPVVSQHPRYWSIYTFIIKQFWDQHRVPQSNSALGRFLRPREVVFAVAALRCKRHPPLLGVVGRNTFPKWIGPNAHEVLPLDLDYLQAPLGGYGQIYRGAMEELGLVTLAESNPYAPLDAPYGEIGSAVAAAFAEAIADTEYYRHYLEQDTGTIPLDVIDELAEASCFCRLVESVHERDLLTDVLMGRAQNPHPTHTRRAETIRMMLDLAGATADSALSEPRFRQLVYYKHDSMGKRWDPATAIQPMCARWWAVQLRDYVVSALNALFVDFSRWGVSTGGTLYPVPLEDYAERVRSLPLSDSFHLSGSASAISVAELSEAVNAVIDEQGWPLATSPAEAELSEHRLSNQFAMGVNPLTPVLAVLTLMVVRRRYHVIKEAGGISPVQEQMLREGGFERESVEVVFNWLDHHIARDGPFAQFIVNLVHDLVIRQHLRTARGKLPEDTFRFFDESDGYRFVDLRDSGIGSISVRFNAISHAMAGLGLIDGPLTQGGHGPTARGLVEMHV